jgi:hypothetical protein
MARIQPSSSCLATRQIPSPPCQFQSRKYLAALGTGNVVRNCRDADLTTIDAAQTAVVQSYPCRIGRDPHPPSSAISAAAARPRSLLPQQSHGFCCQGAAVPLAPRSHARWSLSTASPYGLPPALTSSACITLGLSAWVGWESLSWRGITRSAYGAPPRLPEHPISSATARLCVFSGPHFSLFLGLTDSDVRSDTEG